MHGCWSNRESSALTTDHAQKLAERQSDIGSCRQCFHLRTLRFGWWDLSPSFQPYWRLILVCQIGRNRVSQFVCQIPYLDEYLRVTPHCAILCLHHQLENVRTQKQT